MRKKFQWLALGVSLTVVAAGTAAWLRSGHTDATAGSTEEQLSQSSVERRRKLGRSFPADPRAVEVATQRMEAGLKGLDLTETQTSAIAQPLALVETVYEQAVNRGDAVLVERAAAERAKLLKAASDLPAGAFDGEAER